MVLLLFCKSNCSNFTIQLSKSRNSTHFAGGATLTRSAWMVRSLTVAHEYAFGSLRVTSSSFYKEYGIQRAWLGGPGNSIANHCILDRVFEDIYME